MGLACSLAEAAPKRELLARDCFVRGPDASRDDHTEEASLFFHRLAETAAPADAVVEDAVAIFEAANGAVRIADLARQTGTSTRELNRRFTRIVGISPKLFARILQINWVVGLIYSNEVATLTRIAQEAGFYDQAHFNHAMRRFFNEGPREFLRSDHAAFKTFLGASRRYGPAAPPDAA